MDYGHLAAITAMDERSLRMGDENEDFTQEELVTLGEEEEEETEEGTGTQEETEETGESTEETETEDTTSREITTTEEQTENMVPQSRFDKVYGKHKTIQEKLDLLKTDPDAYYEQYPDEKPKPDVKETIRPVTFSEAGQMVVQGGEYEGKTLAEVHEEDPFAAYDLYHDYKAAIDKEATEKEKKAEAVRSDVEKEANTFQEARAKELFDKPISELSPDETKRIDEVSDTLLDWMDSTGRLAYNFEDAYKIMTESDRLDKVTRALVDSLKKSSVSSVSGTKSSDVATTGYEKILGMDNSSAQTYIENMTEVEYDKFLKEAPQSVKDKFPHFDWD